MPYLGDTPTLPFSGTEPLSRHCSAMGAQKAEPRAGSQALALLEAYRQHGPLTDHEASKLLNLPLATICARRGYLRQHEWVGAKGAKPGPFGTSNTLWGLL